MYYVHMYTCIHVEHNKGKGQKFIYSYMQVKYSWEKGDHRLLCVTFTDTYIYMHIDIYVQERVHTQMKGSWKKATTDRCM